MRTPEGVAVLVVGGAVAGRGIGHGDTLYASTAPTALADVRPGALVVARIAAAHAVLARQLAALATEVEGELAACGATPAARFGALACAQEDAPLLVGVLRRDAAGRRRLWSAPAGGEASAPLCECGEPEIVAVPVAYRRTGPAARAARGVLAQAAAVAAAVAWAPRQVARAT